MVLGECSDINICGYLKGQRESLVKGSSNLGQEKIFAFFLLWDFFFFFLN